MSIVPANIARDAMRERAARWQSEMIRAEERAPVYRFDPLAVDDIRRSAEFVVLEPLMNGEVVTQLAMKVVVPELDKQRNVIVKGVYTVYAKTGEATSWNDVAWEVSCPDWRKHNGAAIIEAVRERIANNAGRRQAAGA